MEVLFYNTGKDEKNEIVNTVNTEGNLCKLCERSCSLTCDCACHVPYCNLCEKKSCDYKRCGCRCHIEEQSFLNDQPLETTPSNDDIGPIIISPKNNSQREYSPPPDLTPPQAIPSSSSNKPTPSSDSKRSSSVSNSQNNSSNNMKTIKPESAVSNKGNNNKDAVSQKSSEISDKFKKKSSTKSEMSKETKLETDSVVSEDDRRGPKGMRRLSKYSEALNTKKVIYIFILNKDVDILDVMKGKKSESSKKIISFRSKSKDKNSNRALIEKESSLNPEEFKKKKEIPLNLRLKAQFEKFKLEDLKVPDKLDNYVDEKFVRDKSEVTKYMEKLTRDLRHENYSDKAKLAKNIFTDFENQESWQSYTTLLFADLGNEAEDISKYKRPEAK